ncbi:hypothetical protein NLM27_25725 [Bradyrhizobium sp. CCGB12]|uniref:hypothetical protein n=1 Tax=Bradyrhizobium sp. CCGB12 TaxID=2949632 RepID=UPI0020B26814|nr:hypothetical protein [Bradyrhizobium sp. CCGB12]MCP3392187.1 hypothetical protein [Bradyrhizobium sp. CCGB12]
MSFQLSILKILAGQPGGRARLELIKQHLAIFYTSGPEWPARMKRIASREPNLDIFGQKLIERQEGYWIITAQGRKILEMLEVLDASEKLDQSVAQGQPEAQVEPPAGDERPPLPAAPPRSIARRIRPPRKGLWRREGRSV